MDPTPPRNSYFLDHFPKVPPSGISIPNQPNEFRVFPAR
jgi:hypothetical protein